ncbi:amidohydrolase family protein [Nocardia sp. R16R-3T]
MKIIALEEHFATRAIWDANADHPVVRLPRLLAERGGAAVGKELLSQLLDLGEQRLAEMDAAGIDLQVLSHTTPGPEELAPDLSIRLAAEANNAMAQAIAAHLDRFAGFASLPMSDPAAAVKELDKAVTDLGFVGALINGHVNGRYLDDQYFWPVFEAAEALRVPVYLHPNRLPQPVIDASYQGLPPVISESLAGAGWGWHVDTGLHALRLILGGVFDRFPNLKVIIGHLGETLPSMIWRVNWMMSGISGLAKPVKDYFTENFYLTTSGIFDYAPFAAALHAVGTDRIMFSVDYPYSRNAEGRAFFDQLPLSRPDKEKISHANAEQLLGLDG